MVTVLLHLNKYNKERDVNIVDTRLGHLLVINYLTNTYGWVEHPDLISWENLSFLSELGDNGEPMEVVDEERTPCPGVIVAAGIKIVESPVAITGRSSFDSIRFAEYRDGKVYIEGECDCNGQAVPNLKLSNSRYANHTAIGYKTTTVLMPDGRSQPVIVKLGFLPDTKMTSREFDQGKHRCNKAEILAMARLEYKIQTINCAGSSFEQLTEIRYHFDVQKSYSLMMSSFVYELGKIVEEPNYDGRYDGCGVGIHFYFSQQMAIGYYMYAASAEKLNPQCFDDMTNAIYCEAMPKQLSQYVYVPTSEAARIIQRRWRKNALNRSSTVKLPRQNGSSRIEDAEDVQRDMILTENIDSGIHVPTGVDNILDKPEPTKLVWIPGKTKEFVPKFMPKI